MNNVRAFIAIELEQNLKNRLAEIQSELQTLNCDIRWVKPGNIHLTLKFLGNTSIQLLSSVSKIMDEETKNFSPIDIQMTKIGAFPSVKNARIVWMGIEDSKSLIKSLQSRLEKTLEKIGFKKEDRDFSPHLTLGRVKSNKNLNQLKVWTDQNPSSAQSLSTVTHITLFKSLLHSKGAIYEVLHQSFLCPGLKP